MAVQDEIRNILESVDGIGHVYDFRVNVKNEQEVNERLVKNERVNAIFFYKSQDLWKNAESFFDKENTKTFRFVLFLGYDYDDGGISITALGDAIMEKFNANETLNDSVLEHENISMIDNQQVMFGVILCEELTFELTVRRFLYTGD